jgi:tRNA-Thr(GGU) m(6)t(6)A37 methyltransferase TsaA
VSWWNALIERVRAFFRRDGGPVIPRDPVSVRPIGVVRNGVVQPRAEGWATLKSDVILRDELTALLDGIEGYSHLIVVFAFDRVPEAEQRERVQPRGDPRVPEQGVLATRRQLRPSPLGVSVVRLLKRRRNILRVEGLDAIDGTPVLDVKPYFPNYDAIPDAGIPEWARALQQ